MSSTLLDGRTPLHIAAENGDTAAVESLLNSGMDPNAEDENRSTPLHIAAWEGHTDTIEALLRGGADPNARNKFDWIPLHSASQNGCIETIDVLINAGTDLNVKIDSRWILDFAFEIAFQNIRTDAVHLLGKKIEWTPLHFAAWRGHINGIKPLVNDGESLNAKDRYGRTPLSLAVRKGHADAVVALIESAGLYEARSYKNPLKVRALLHRLLFLSAEKGHVLSAKMLVEAGADPNVRGRYGRTPLHIAKMEGQVDVSNTLVDLGADRNAVDEKGMTPSNYAERRKNREDRRLPPLSDHEGPYITGEYVC